jgi:hypothetical protein
MRKKKKKKKKKKKNVNFEDGDGACAQTENTARRTSCSSRSAVRQDARKRFQRQVY